MLCEVAQRILLPQVVGCKYVRLYAPRCTKALRPGVAHLANTSTLSLERARGGEDPVPPDLPFRSSPLPGMSPPPPPFPNHALGRRLWHDRQFLLLAVRAGRGCPQRRVTGGGARRSETVVGEGEGITIPAGHWHYVRALTPSLSVNFWWRKAGGSGGAGGAGERA